MSRYLEMKVSGTRDAVAERAVRAFRQVGRVDECQPETFLEGTIRIRNCPAFVRVEWKEKDSQVKLIISASSDDTLNRAADASLYKYARAYEDAGWPDPERDRVQRQQFLQKISFIGVGAALVIAVIVYVLITR